jgi:hypothetical protein
MEKVVKRRMKVEQLKLKNNGPIPGENFTSDTRNYPWHRPPEIVDLDEAIEVMAKKIMEPKAANGLLTFLEMGMTVSTAVSTLVLGGIEAGKWTPDMALLLAGPTARMIELMAKKAGIKYRMGIEEDEEILTSNFFTKSAEKINIPSSEDMKSIKDEVKDSPTPTRGFGRRVEK